MMQILLNILISSSLILLVAFSFSLIYYPVKFFHFAHGAIIAWAPYCTWFLSRSAHLPVGFAIVLSIVAAALLGAACEILIYRAMRRRNAKPLVYLIASIGLYIMLQNVLSLLFGDDTKQISQQAADTGLAVFGAYITPIQLLTLFLSIGLFVSLNALLRHSVAGRSFRAVSVNPELCTIYGISSSRIILYAFCAGSALAGITGILSALDTNMTPGFGFNLLLYGVVAMIIGGVGSTRGLIAGCLLLAGSQQLAAYLLGSKWMDIVSYLILILFLIWKPLGFSGVRLKKTEI